MREVTNKDKLERFMNELGRRVAAGLIEKERLRELFVLIKPQLISYPAIDPGS